MKLSLPRGTSVYSETVMPTNSSTLQLSRQTEVTSNSITPKYYTGFPNVVTILCSCVK